jgi:hypothetical protein
MSAQPFRDIMCDVAREAIFAGERTMAVQAHLDLCRACAYLAAQMDEIDAMVRTMVVEPAPPGLCERILARLDEERAKEKTGHRAAVTCEECGQRHRLERRIVAPETLWIVCHGCELSLRVDVQAAAFEAAQR